MWSSAGQSLADQLSALLPQTNVAVLHSEAFGTYGEPGYGFDRVTVISEDGGDSLGGAFGPGIHAEFSLHLDAMLPCILPDACAPWQLFACKEERSNPFGGMNIDTAPLRGPLAEAVAGRAHTAASLSVLQDLRVAQRLMRRQQAKWLGYQQPKQAEKDGQGAEDEEEFEEGEESGEGEEGEEEFEDGEEGEGEE
jgi:hypothetical protein|eukprot:3616980-Prymnesium_polylepis.2